MGHSPSGGKELDTLSNVHPSGGRASASNEQRLRELGLSTKLQISNRDRERPFSLIHGSDKKATSSLG